MRSHSVWGNEGKTIIYRKMKPFWTWDEFLECCEKEHQMAESVQHPVSLIIDLSLTLTLPIGSLTHFKRTLENCCEQCKKQIIINKNQAFWTLHRLLIQMLPHAKNNFFIVRTPEEAYQLAQEKITNSLVP